MAGQLGALVALPWDLSSSPRSHMVVHKQPAAISWAPLPSSGLRVHNTDIHEGPALVK